MPAGWCGRLVCVCQVGECLTLLLLLLLQVTAIMVTHAVEYSGHGDFTDTVLLDSISPTHSEEKQQESQG